MITGADRMQKKTMITSVYRMQKTKSLCRGEGKIRLAVIADVHNSELAEADSPLVRAIRQSRPDAVLCSGDMVIAGTKEAMTDRSLRLLQELAGKYPVYMVNGNHESRLQQRPEKYGPEHADWFAKVRDAGVHLLQNRCEILEIGGAQIAVYGYELPLRYYQRSKYISLPLREMRQALGKPDPRLYTVLLAHHPDYARTYARWGADVALSGHVHGGLIRLPLLGGVIGAHFTPFPRYTRGMYPIPRGAADGKDRDRMPMIVSAGLGDHTLPLRFNNPRELVILEYAEE